MRWWPFTRKQDAQALIATAIPEETKTSEAGPLIVVGRLNQPTKPNVPQLQFSKEGYQQNVIAYRCVDAIARAAAAVPWTLMQGKTEIDDPKVPLLALLAQPNARESGFAYFQRVVAFRLIHGNSFIEQVCDGQDDTPSPKMPPVELWCHRPDRMEILPGPFGLPGAFRFRAGGAESKTWPANAITGESAIIHWSGFNPIDDFFGMSSIEPASHPIDQHNGSSEYNTALLKNGAQPPGFIRYNPAGERKTNLTPQQREDVKRALMERYAGPRHAGETPIVDGQFEWVPSGFSPREMEWLAGRNEAARDICRAFAVPPMMLGIPGDNTYSNYREARMAFYEDTVLPLLDELCDVLNHRLTPYFGANLKLSHDLDEIPALAPKRESKFQMMVQATFLTTNEKREAVGYDKIADPAADEILVPSTLIPLTDQGMTQQRGIDAGLQPDPADAQDPENDAEDAQEPGEEPPATGKPGKPAKKTSARERQMAAELLREGWSPAAASDVVRLSFRRRA